MWYFGTHGDLKMTGPKPANGPEGLNTSDPEGNAVTYGIVGGDPNSQFAINSTTGVITVAKATIDIEATPQFVLQVKAQDMQHAQERPQVFGGDGGSVQYADDLAELFALVDGLL